MNTIVIDKSDPAMAEALASCKVGVPETFTIEATPVSVDGVLVAKINSVSVSYDEEAETETAEAEQEAKPYKPRMAEKMPAGM